MHTTRPTLSALQGKVLFPEITIHLRDPCLSIYHRLEAHHRYFTSKQADTRQTEWEWWRKKKTKEDKAKHLTILGRVPTPQLMRCQKDARIPFSKQTKTGLMTKAHAHNSRPDVAEESRTEKERNKERRREWEWGELRWVTDWDRGPVFPLSLPGSNGTCVFIGFPVKRQWNITCHPIRAQHSFPGDALTTAAIRH